MSAETTIHVHHKKPDPFARVPRTVLSDDTLSWKAKGILSYLIGKPSDWKVLIADLVKQSTDKHAAVKTGLKELRTAGYAKLECARDPKNGRVTGWKWHISDVPEFVNNFNPNNSPEVDFPLVENPQVENPQVENPLLLRSDLTKTDQKQRKTTNKEAAFAASVVGTASQSNGEATLAQCFIKAWELDYQTWHEIPYQKKKASDDLQAATQLFKDFPEAKPRDFRWLALKTWLSVQDQDGPITIRKGKSSFDPFFHSSKAQWSIAYFCQYVLDVAREQQEPLSNLIGRIDHKQMDIIEGYIKGGRYVEGPGEIEVTCQCGHRNKAHSDAQKVHCKKCHKIIEVAAVRS